MNDIVEEIETKVEELEKTIAKIKALIADSKVCSSDITKALIANALKKYAVSISLIDAKAEGQA